MHGTSRTVSGLVVALRRLLDIVACGAPLLACLWPSRARAEGPVQAGFALLGGVGRRDLGDLDAQLARAGYRPLGQNFSSIGIGADIWIGRLLVDTELRFDSVAGATSLDGTRQAELGAESILLGAGWAVYRSRRLRLFPSLAVGYASGQVLAPPPSPRGDDDRVSESALLVVPSAALDTLLVSSGEGSDAGLFLGLRLGYVFSVPLHDWSGSALAHPDLGMPGSSLRIVLGYRFNVGSQVEE